MRISWSSIVACRCTKSSLRGASRLPAKYPRTPRWTANRSLAWRFDPHRQAIQRSISGSVVERQRIREIVVACTGDGGRARQAHAGALVAEPMRQANDAGHHRFARARLDVNRAGARAQLHHGAILESTRAQISRMHEQMMARLAFEQARRVVHPGIVAAYLAAPNQLQRAFG